MLSFTLKGENLLLDENTTVRLVFSNPICFIDKNQGDIGLGLNIPINNKNRAILGHPDRFEKYAAGSDRKFPGFEIRFSGILFLSGTLIINHCEDENYSCWLQGSLGALSEEQSNKNITDMGWPIAQTFSDKESYSDELDKYNITTILNPGFWDGIGREEPVPGQAEDPNGIPISVSEKMSVMKKDHLNNYAFYINNKNLPTVNSGLVISPFLFLRYFIKESLKINKFFIDRNDMISENYGLSLCSNLSIYNNFNIVDIVPETELFEDWNWDSDLRMNVQVGFNKITSYNWGVTQFAFRNLLPKLKYGAAILGIQNFLNYVFRFKNNFKVDIIDRNEIFSGTAYDLTYYLVGTILVGERKNVTLKFVSEYDSYDSEFGSEFEDLSERRHDFRDSVATYNDLKALTSVSIGELRLVRSEDKIYEYKWKVQVLQDMNFNEIQHDALDWEFVASGPQPFFHGSADEVEEIKTPISTVKITEDGAIRIPKTNQRGNIASIHSVYNSFSFRLIAGNSDGLIWDGEYGLFKTRWEKFANFWKNRLSVSANFNLPGNILYFLIENITGKFRTTEGEFIISEMEVTLGMNKIGTTKITGYKI